MFYLFKEILNNIVINVSLIVSSILLSYFYSLRKLTSSSPTVHLNLSARSLTLPTQFTYGLLFGVTSFFLSLNSFSIDDIQNSDARYLLIYFVIYYVSTYAGIVTSITLMILKSLEYVAIGLSLHSVMEFNNIIYTVIILFLSIIFSKNPNNHWKNHLLFLVSLLITRTLLIYSYMPILGTDTWLSSLFMYYFLISGLFLLGNWLIRLTTNTLLSINTFRINASVDLLTGLFNRQSLYYQVDNLIKQTNQNEQKNISISLIDLDSFKEINDFYGHIWGDEFLKTFALCLKKSDFDSNFIYRIGGDEFLLIHLNDTQKILESYDRLRVITKQQPLLIEEQSISLNFSVGLCTEPLSENFDLTTAIKKADTALFNAKKNGKNQLVIYKEKEDKTTH